MGKLIKFELRKLFRSKNIYIFIALSLGLLALAVYSSDKVFLGIGTGEIPDYYSGIYSMVTASMSADSALIMSILIPLIVCEDFTLGTVRQILSRGYDRISFYTAKVISVFVATAIVFAVTVFAALLLGNLKFGTADDFDLFNVFITLFCQFMLLIAYSAIFCALCFAIQKSGGSIATCIMVSAVLTTILTGISAIIQNVDFSFTDYWIGKLLMDTASLDVEVKILKRGLLCSAAYFIVGIVGGFLSICKREY